VISRHENDSAVRDHGEFGDQRQTFEAECSSVVPLYAEGEVSDEHLALVVALLTRARSMRGDGSLDQVISRDGSATDSVVA